MLKRSVLIAGVASAAVGLATFAAVTGGAGEPERADCPGKVVCPLTGELVCKDKCPLIDPNRPDCPGRIECELTGELVCKDRCPVRQVDIDEAVNVPACCRTAG